MTWQLINQLAVKNLSLKKITLLTKITTAQNEATLSYHGMRGLYFPAVVFEASICMHDILID